MIRSATLRSLAKINLDLRVLHKREDGFHELRSVFQTISLEDKIEISFEPARRTKIELDDPLQIPNNLVLRAAEAILHAGKARGIVRLSLKKKIPMGGGLGGGSSNAAAVLLGLPALTGRAIPFEQLSAIAAKLGSDVPFFLKGGTALALGRGEELYGLPEIAQEPILVLHSGVHVSTPEAYRALGRGLTWPESSRYINDFRLYVRALEDSGSARAACALSKNDFEPAVFRQFPQLKALRKKLSKLSAGARMTGSGSAIFALFGSAEERAQTQTSLVSDRGFGGIQVMPARLVSRAGYRRLWRNQLQEHIHLKSDLWPPRSRYER
jgi:4-diphosphocytidyl-2-C-methyl-D-erythritol kinase